MSNGLNQDMYLRAGTITGCSAFALEADCSRVKAKIFDSFSLQVPQKEDLVSFNWNPWNHNEIISTNHIFSEVLIAEEEATI